MVNWLDGGAELWDHGLLGQLAARNLQWATLGLAASWPLLVHCLRWIKIDDPKLEIAAKHPVSKAVSLFLGIHGRSRQNESWCQKVQFLTVTTLNRPSSCLRPHMLALAFCQ